MITKRFGVDFDSSGGALLMLLDENSKEFFDRLKDEHYT